MTTLTIQMLVPAKNDGLSTLSQNDKLSVSSLVGINLCLKRANVFAFSLFNVSDMDKSCVRSLIQQP